MTSNFRKATITILLTVCMAISMFAVTAFAENTDSTSTNADSTSVNHTCEKEVVEYTATQAAKYIAGDNTYPKLEGYLFAGWYNNDSCNKEDAIAGGTPSGEKAFALFVPEHVLSIQAQVSTNLIDDDVSTDADAKGSLRFITSVDSLLYKQVGFEVYYTANGVTRKATSASNKVYSKLYEMDSENVWKKTPSDVFCNVSKYFKICTLKNFTMETYMNTEFTVKPYWITMDGDKVYGVEATKSFEEGCLRDTVWVTDGGVDEPNYGGYNNPYGTLDYAITHVENGGTVRVKDNLTIAADAAWTAHDKNVTITCDDKDDAVEQLIYTADANFDICINDSVTFTDVAFTLPTDYTTRIFAQGHKLVIKEDVTFTNESTVQLLGGSNSGAVESTHLEVYAGTYSAIFGGSDTKDVLGDTKVIVGGIVNSDITATEHSKSHILCGAGWKGVVYGNTNVEVQSGAKFNYVFGGGDNAASVVKGSTNVHFAGEAMAIYGGSAAGVNSDTHVKMTGGYVEQVFGGCESNSMTGNTDVQILGGEVARRIYGGCYNDQDASWTTGYHVTGYTSVLIDKNANISQSYGSDDSLVAISRNNAAFDDERGAFIFNDYTNNANKDKTGVDTLASLVGINSQTHYFVRATSGGMVTSAGECIYIAPESGKVATVTLASVDGEVVHYASGNSYYPLPDVNTADTLNLYVTFNETEATDFIASAEAKIATGEGYAYFETLEQAIVAAEKTENATIENLSATKKLASIVIKDSANGTVTTDKRNCIVGEQVTLTVAGTDGYYYDSLKVDGVEVGKQVNANGQYTFTATKENHTVEVSFAEATFDPSSEWNVLRQNVGILSVSECDGDTNWINTKDYAYRGVTVHAKDMNAEAGNFGLQIQLTFENDETFRFRLHNTDGDGAYDIQTMNGDTLVPNWQNPYTLDENETKKVTGEDGIDFRVTVVGETANVYLGDKTEPVCAFDLSKYNNSSDVGDDQSVENCVAKVGIRFYGNSGQNVFMPYELEKVTKINVSTDSTRGTVTTDRAFYTIGEKVTLTVAEEDGYYYDSLKVDGVEVGKKVNANGQYTFIAIEDNHTVEANFAEATFDPSSEWNVLRQNVGILLALECDGDTNWIWSKDCAYRGVTVHAKDMNAEAGNFGLQIQLTFENGETFRFRLHNTDGDGAYDIQTMNGDTLVPNWQNPYTLDDNETKKVTGEDGIDFRVTVVGETANVYLGDKKNPVCTFDLSKYNNSSDVGDDQSVENCVAKVGIRLYGNSGQNVFMPYELERVSKIHVSTDCTNGTITTDKTMCTVGEKVTLTVAGEEGYYFDSLTVDGVEVGEQVDENGQYTFTATKDNHTVEASFAEAIFDSNTSWNVLGQNVGILRAPATSNGNSGWVSTTGSYNEATVTVKDLSGGTQTFGMLVRFYFSNYKHISIRLVNEVGKNNGWVLQSENDNVYGYTIHHSLSGDEIAKVTGDGLEFKMVRIGTSVDLYLDGKKVVSGLDLTRAGITAEMTATVNFKLYGNNNLVTEIPFTLSKGWITSYQGKYLSILGDSISTYEGISNVGTTNTTIAGYNAWYNGDWKDVLESEDETYWGQVISKYKMNLLVNNSCGGNRLMDASGTNVTVPAGYMRVEELAANTGELNGTKPDIILINMGTNDYIKGRTLGEHNDATYTGVVSDTGYIEPTTFTEAYIITLEKAKTLYPDAKICCFTLLPTSYNTDWDTLNAYNTRIREIVARYDDVTLVDIANDTGITTSNYTDYTFDGTHPNLNGIKAIATIFERALLGIEQ